MEHLSHLSYYQTTSRVLGKISLYLEFDLKWFYYLMKYVKINFENTNTTRKSTAITNLAVLPSIYDLSTC